MWITINKFSGLEHEACWGVSQFIISSHVLILMLYFELLPNNSRCSASKR